MIRIVTCLTFVTAFSIYVTAQDYDWALVPFGQTSYFQDAQSGEILPMKCDAWNPGGIGDFYWIYRQALEDEFDTCAYKFWNTIDLQDPRADFQGFVYQWPGTVTGIFGRNATFSLPMNGQPGTWEFFGNSLLIRFDVQIQEPVLGTMDSVRIYSIFESDSVTEVGDLRLSKHHGLTAFVPFKTLEGTHIDSSVVWELVGFQDSSQAVGTGLPEKMDYLPYVPGDKILLKHSDSRYDQDLLDWFEYTEYFEITVSSLDTTHGSVTLNGVMNRYDEQGFYMDTDSNHALLFDPQFSQMIDHPYSVPHYADVLSAPQWYETNEWGIRVNTGGYERDVCDSFNIFDGLTHYMSFTTEAGFVYSYIGGLARPPETLELVAAEGQNLNHGTWPTWLSTPEIDGAGEVKVYPNPATDQVYVHWKGGGLLRVSAIDIQGRTVLSSDQLSAPMLVNIGRLAKGAYTLRVESDRGVQFERLIVQ